MKAIKKISALALAVIMLLSLSISAFAAGNGVITVEKTLAGKDYTLYKIFDLESYEGSTPTTDKDENGIEDDSTAPHAYYINSDSPWYGFVKPAEGGNAAGAGAAYIDLRAASADKDNAKYYITWKTGKDSAADVAEFAKLALDYAKANAIEGTTKEAAADNDPVVFDNLDLG